MYITRFESNNKTCTTRMSFVCNVRLLTPLLCDSLVIRGDKDEKAVLCSGDKTYDLKIADTSNLLLLVPGCKTPDQLSGSQDSPHLVHTQVLKHHSSVLPNSYAQSDDCIKTYCRHPDSVAGLGVLQQLLGGEEAAAQDEEAEAAFDGESLRRAIFKRAGGYRNPGEFSVVH